MNLLDKGTVAGKIVQVLIGLVLTYVLFIIAKSIMNLDKFDLSDVQKTTRTETEIIDGMADSSSLVNTRFNTMLPYLDNYINIKPSVNIKGGAQFSYSFWLNSTNLSDPLYRNKCVFLMGDDKRYEYTVNNKQTTDFLTMCPYFGFGDNDLDFVVKFNTSHNITEQLYAKRMVSTDPIYRNNLASILQNNWVMFTIVIEDNMPLNSLENGIRVSLYMNDLLYDTGMFKGMLKQNKGYVCFFPDQALNGLKLASMKYYNYALNGDEVKKIYAAGVNTKPASYIINKMDSKMKVNVSTNNILNYYNL